jgi:hypothetical protein
METLKILILVVFCCFISCQKDEKYELPVYFSGPQDTGWGKAVRDGKAWNATAFARRHQDGSGFIGLDFNTYSEFEEIREVLAFNEVPFKVGAYSINGKIDDYNDNLVGSNFSIRESDGDVIGVLYNNDMTIQGVMNITYTDSTNNIVEGNFDVIKFDRLVPENAPYPERVEFRNGTFRMKIID